MKSGFRCLMVAGALCAGLIAGQGSASAESINFSLNWLTGPQHTEFVVAKEKGFYKDQGLDVNIHSPAATTDAIKLVASGQDAFGIAFSGDVVQARSQGVPVVSVAVIHRHNPLGLLLNPSSGIKSPKDLEGKRIGLTPPPNNRAMFWDFVARAGLDKSKLNVVTIQFNGPQLVAVDRLDACDAVTFYEPEAYKQITGKAPPFMSYSKYGVPDNYFFVIVASEDTVKNHPDTVRKFLKGSLEGEAWTIDHPDEAQKILLANAKDISPEFAKAAREAISPLLTDANTASKGLGWQDPEVWKTTVQWMKDQKLISGDVNSAAVFTNDFLPQPPITK